MTKNDHIRRAINVMGQENDTGYCLANIFRIECPGLNELNIARESTDLLQDVKLSIKHMRACLTRLANELKAIDE